MLCQDPKTGRPHLTNGQAKAVSPSLLEFAADNDVESFKKAIEGGARVDEPEEWYARQIGKHQMTVEQRTAIMIASLYGSVEVLSFILSLYDMTKLDINLANGSDGLTALHCAAAGGSAHAVETLKLLLESGANVNAKDVHGRKPSDVLIVSPKLLHKKFIMQTFLHDGGFSTTRLPVDEIVQSSMDLNGKMNFSLASTEESDIENYSSELLCKIDSSDSFSSLGSSSPPFSPLSPSSPEYLDAHLEKVSGDNTPGKPKSYSLDSSVPDIKNSIYTSDEFRMFSFKIRPCSRAYSHDWTECPFVHPGENARRRDPRRYHYSCVPCPDFRKGACRRGDGCEYAHGVFECWLHPAQYRTRLCKDGTSCARRVCFFAHTTPELRPLYASTGSAVSSPRASPAFDSRSISPPTQSFSPASTLMIPPPFSPSSRSCSTSTPPLSPSASSLRAPLGGSWSPPNVPTLHLPSGGGLHSSRLRAALSARDIPSEEFDDVSDFDPSMASDLLLQFNQTQQISSLSAGAGNKFGRMGKYSNLALSIPSSSLSELIAAEINSPKSSPHSNLLTELAQASPKMHHHIQSQMQLQMNALLSPRFQNVPHVQDHQFSRLDNHVNQADYFDTATPLSVPIPCTEFELPGYPSALLSDPSLGFSSLKSAFHLKDKGSWSSKSLSGTISSSSSSASWSDWGSPSGKPDWGVQGQDLRKLQKAPSLASHGEIEPDLSWVQSLVKDGPGDIEKVGPDCFVGNVTDGLKKNAGDHLRGAWIEQAQQNQVVV